MFSLPIPKFVKWSCGSLPALIDRLDERGGGAWRRQRVYGFDGARGLCAELSSGRSRWS